MMFCYPVPWARKPLQRAVLTQLLFNLPRKTKKTILLKGGIDAFALSNHIAKLGRTIGMLKMPSKLGTAGVRMGH